MLSESLPEPCLPDLLRARVRAHPGRTAVSCGDARLTFQQLDTHAAALAGALRRIDVSRDECVGVFVNPSLELMIGVWGVLYAGGAYLPLSVEYPDERLRYMITNSGARTVLTDVALRPRLAELAPPGTQVITPADAAGYQGAPAAGGPASGDLAYIIYTSGSTGQPKGIMIEHRSIVSQMRWLAGAQGLDERRVVIQKTPLSFDAGQWEILAPACGSAVLMAEPGSYRDPERLLAQIVAGSVTTLQGVPTLLQALVDTGELHRCTSLRQVFSGGEALSKSLAMELLAALPAIELVNLYGPSECTINSSAYTVDRAGVRQGPDIVPIGTPVADTTYAILDAHRTPVGPGETGELHVGGVQLARGYLHRPDLTADRFLDNPLPGVTRLYRTGDLARWNDDGTAQFAGRTDSQVKLRGCRVELDEVRMAIEAHNWVKRAAVIVRDDPRTGTCLVAFTQLHPTEAALMDQGNHAVHHQSKQSKMQIRAQLSNPGCRDDTDLAGRPLVVLPGGTPTEAQRRTVFARKTYRFFDGGTVTRDDVLRLLDTRPQTSPARGLDSLSLADLGELLRWFGQFSSNERLLAKYGYPSPGSLYATQLHLEISQVAGLRPGDYYYHPVHHHLILIRPGRETGPRLTAHFIGRKRAIEPVYRNNIREVLQIETGHMIGLFDAVLPAYGLSIHPGDLMPTTPDRLGSAPEDYYLGSFDIVPGTGDHVGDPVDIYVQAHPGTIPDVPAGQYRYADGQLERISAELIQRRHVIAINQEVYDRASLGITLLSRHPDVWMRYVDLGRALQRLQMNDFGVGFMSSGYSSATGHDLPSARRIASILGRDGVGTASYFVVGGRVSEEQRRSEGMKEDAVHMRGPAEILKDDLAERLPHYMIPNRVTVLDAMPLIANGKVDVQALHTLDGISAALADTPFVAPRTATEEALARLWRAAMKRDDEVSVHDDFFAFGGNSLLAVTLINRINRELGTTLPLQVLFESPTIEQLAQRVDRDGGATCSRLVLLQAAGTQQPVFCWPGLGGYPMNLRLLAGTVQIDRPVFGIQAHGINDGETPFPTIAEMAAQDLELIKRQQPEGPYTLWGYSFGARVAFEAAYQLERAGDRIENLFLIAPGQPRVGPGGRADGGHPPSFDDPTFVAILFSVFAGSLTHEALRECLAVATDEETFTAFVCERFGHLHRDLVRRVITVVRQTFPFDYACHELAERRISTAVTIFRARGDDSCVFETANGWSPVPPTVLDLDADHYSLLRASGVDELVTSIRRRLHRIPSKKRRSPLYVGQRPRLHIDRHVDREDRVVPHVSIKHFPAPLSAEKRTALVAAITDAVTDAFSCDEGVVSIALEPVPQDAWNEQVYIPEVITRRELLCKAPNY